MEEARMSASIPVGCGDIFLRNGGREELHFIDSGLVLRISRRAGARNWSRTRELCRHFAALWKLRRRRYRSGTRWRKLANVFQELDFSVVDITSPELVALASERRIKTIVCLNVIEHIEDDAKAVTNLARALEPGGHLLIIVPALELLFNDLDRLAGHHRRYSRDQMRSRLEAAGLDVVRCDYFNSIGGLGWLANRALRHGSLNDKAVNSQISLFDKWLVPLSRLADPATRSFFGQSVIAVGRKR